MRGKRILVTGGSGFIGSHLVRRLLNEAAEVAVVVRYGNIMKNERLLPFWDDLRILEADLRNRGALEVAIGAFRPERVFHLAAYNHVGSSFTQFEECFDVNAKGTANLLDVCRGAERFLYVSTSEVYGHQEHVPFVESMTPEPISPYGITKYAGELYCRMHQRMGASPQIAIVRPFNTFGPYQSTKAVIPELILGCLRGGPILTTKGEQTREFNYVEDIVEGMLLAMEKAGEVLGPVNLATGKEVAIRDLIAKIVDITQTSARVEIGALPYRPTEIWRMCADATRARELIGWNSGISLEEGLQRTVDWFRLYLERGQR